MAATDYFKKTGNSTATTMAAPGHTIGGTSITVGSTANWPTTTGVTFAIDSVTLSGTEEVQVPGTYTLWHGQVVGSTITNMTLAAESPNSDQNYAAGSLTRVYIPVSAALHNKMVDGILVHADQDGTLKADSVDVTAVIKDNVVSNAKLSEFKPVDGVFDHISSGCVWSGDSYGGTRVASCTSGVVYLGGKRLTVAAVTSRTFTASKDVYCDLSDNGDGTAIWNYTDNTTNAASPALTAGRVRGAIVVVGASSIANAASINQGQEDRALPIASLTPYAVTDSLGNLICPRDPYRRILGYRQIVSTPTGTSSGTAVQVTGLTVPVIVPTGRRIRISLSGKSISGSVAGYVSTTIWDGAVSSGTQLQQNQPYISTGAGTASPSVDVVTTPTTASKTYNAGFHTTAGTITFDADATYPASIKVELF